MCYCIRTSINIAKVITGYSLPRSWRCSVSTSPSYVRPGGAREVHIGEVIEVVSLSNGIPRATKGVVVSDLPAASCFRIGPHNGVVTHPMSCARGMGDAIADHR